ncbi:MAG TPA: formate dehydrogenase subunit gamma [Rhizobacter sp.]|nr:formate dehydrogenase subunit gamma [Rhizobacter sp.]
MTTVTSPETLALVREVLARRASEPGALLPILHELQDSLGHIPADVVPEIASALNLSRAEVHGVVTYYHHFRDHPAAGKVVQICRAESCKAMGADALLAHAQQHLGCAVHGHSADGAFTLEPVYCLGLCASSPAMVIGEEVHARITPQRFDALIAEARSTT